MKIGMTASMLAACMALASNGYAGDWSCTKDGHQMEVEGGSVTEQHANCDKQGGTWTQNEVKTQSDSNSGMGGGGGW